MLVGALIKRKLDSYQGPTEVGFDFGGEFYKKLFIIFTGFEVVMA